MIGIPQEIKARVIMKFNQMVEKFTGPQRASRSPEHVFVYDKFGNHNGIIEYLGEYYIIGSTLKGDRTVMQITHDQMEYIADFMDAQRPKLKLD